MRKKVEKNSLSSAPRMPARRLARLVRLALAGRTGDRAGSRIEHVGPICRAIEEADEKRLVLVHVLRGREPNRGDAIDRRLARERALGLTGYRCTVAELWVELIPSPMPAALGTSIRAGADAASVELLAELRALGQAEADELEAALGRARALDVIDYRVALRRAAARYRDGK